jgi:hypothetical protein
LASDVAVRLLYQERMKIKATVVALAILLLGTTAATAQSDVGIKAPAAPSKMDRVEKAARPGNAGDDSHRGVRYAPAFIGPTATGETTEFGFSGWIAPAAPAGGTQPGGGDGGWAALGFTLRWGAAPPRPAPKRATLPEALAPSALPASAIR